ncbi:diacylglycerol kinase family protein [Yeguia hominis]|uniref:Diacylglycerol kinase family protein n=1 Tax=Yeguia hominis TaxID=2763662 RepID=A0A926HS23_9FIRM|nr:diacylglycerol kinase family protein [Yeguia hominis]MBC8532941.1 diacylglycerol kinase family protein [Yeguia hominis]
MNKHGHRLSKSFRDAFRGIGYGITQERNMRIHTVAALYVFVFSFFFELSFGQYAALFLTIALVMAAELLNTAIEKLADAVNDQYDPLIGKVKDLAAGGVLVCALFAVAVGVVLFWRPESFRFLWSWFCARPWMVGVLAVLTALAVCYIVRGPRFWIRNSKSQDGMER